MARHLSKWLLAVIIIMAMIIIAVGIGWVIRNNNDKNAQQTPTQEGFSHPLVWSVATAGPDSSKNTCQIYQFPTSMMGDVAYIGAPTFNGDTLSGMTGVTFGSETICTDVDEIIAQQMQHSCTGPVGVTDTSIVRCITLNGTSVGIGETEVFYNNILCPAIKQCPGELSLIALNYHGTSTQLNCITRESLPGVPTGLMGIVECNPSDNNQIFRLTRTNPGTDPSTLQPGTQSGMLAQIYDRDSGLCVGVSSQQVENYYDTNFITPINSGCSGAIVPYEGLGLELTECTGGPYPGYVWALFPSMSYCGQPDGCSGCATGYTRMPYTNECCDDKNPTSCPGTAGYESFSTPQQIFYIGGVDFNDVPTGSAQEMFVWAVDNNLPRMFYGGYQGSVTSTSQYPTAVVTPITDNITKGTDISTCNGLSSVGQYLNLILYNTLIQEAPCVAAEISESYCFF